MGALEILQHNIRRHCYKYQPSQISSILGSTSSLSHSPFKNLGFQRPSISSNSNCHSRFRFLGFPRLLSSSSLPPDSQSDTRTDDSIKTRPSSPSIKAVSYPAKPEAPSKADEELPPSPESPTSQRQQVTGRSVFRLAEGDSEKSPDAVESRPLTREDFRYVKDVPSISPVSYPTRVAPLPEDKVSSVTKEEGKVEGEDDRKEAEQLERERRKIEADFRMRRVLRVEEEKAPFPTIIKVEKKKQKVIIDLLEAIREVKANAKRKFFETVEAHVNLGVDPRRGDQMVRGATTLPHGTGKVVRVAVFAEGAAAEEARAAGADIVGGDELIEEIKSGGGKLNFDKCISTPTFMPRLGKIARILGPRGLMPNPKLGSVTSDVAVAVKESKRGRIDFKIDKTAIVHVGLGKVNFSEEALRENVGAFVNALLLAKPVGLKKTSKYAGYVNAFTLSSTMGPGFPVSIQSLSMAADHYNKMQQLK